MTTKFRVMVSGQCVREIAVNEGQLIEGLGWLYGRDLANFETCYYDEGIASVMEV